MVRVILNLFQNPIDDVLCSLGILKQVQDDNSSSNNQQPTTKKRSEERFFYISADSVGICRSTFLTSP